MRVNWMLLITLVSTHSEFGAGVGNVGSIRAWLATKYTPISSDGSKIGRLVHYCYNYNDSITVVYYYLKP